MASLVEWRACRQQCNPDNRHVGPGGKIINDANVVCENDTGYEATAR